MIGQVSDVDLRLLRLFSAVVEAGGFAPATALLNISESTISNHMKELEERVGARLCERGRAGFQLTARGEVVYGLTRELLAQLVVYRNEIAVAVSEIGGTITIGLTDGISTLKDQPVAHAIGSFAARAGNRARISVQAGSPRELERAILEGTCQLAVIPRHRNVGGLEYETLRGETNLFYCSDCHPWFTRDDAACEIAEVATLRCIGRSYIDRFDEQLLGPIAHAASVVTIEAATHLILSGAYVGFLPDHAAAAWLKAGRLRAIRPDQLRFEAELCLVTPRSRTIEGAGDLFARDLRAAFAR